MTYVYYRVINAEQVLVFEHIAGEYDDTVSWDDNSWELCHLLSYFETLCFSIEVHEFTTDQLYRLLKG